MKYLITGATGFMGPHLIKHLLEQGHSCRCLVRSEKAAEKLKNRSVEILRGDITRAASLKGAADDVDRVLHLATLGHMSNFSVTPKMFDDINVAGMANVMQEALRAPELSATCNIVRGTIIRRVYLDELDQSRSDSRRIGQSHPNR